MSCIQNDIWLEQQYELSQENQDDYQLQVLRASHAQNWVDNMNQLLTKLDESLNMPLVWNLKKQEKEYF